MIVSSMYIIGFTEADCLSLYQNAIGDNNPTITLHISKAMTIGPPQVGKSTVRRRLLDLPLPEVSSSTPVMETADTVSLRSSVRTRSLGEAGPSSDAVPSDEQLTWKLKHHRMIQKAMMMIWV